MKLTIADLVKCGVLQGVEKIKGCDGGYGKHGCCGKCFAALYFNQAIDLCNSREIDVGKMFDVEKVEKFMRIGSRANLDGELIWNEETKTFKNTGTRTMSEEALKKIAKLLCDKANELVKEKSHEDKR